MNSQGQSDELTLRKASYEHLHMLPWHQESAPGLRQQPDRRPSQGPLPLPRGGLAKLFQKVRRRRRRISFSVPYSYFPFPLIFSLMAFFLCDLFRFISYLPSLLILFLPVLFSFFPSEVLLPLLSLILASFQLPTFLYPHFQIFSSSFPSYLLNSYFNWSQFSFHRLQNDTEHF